MGLAKNIMQGGFSYGQAETDFMGTIKTGISAAGTTQATATALTADVNLVSTAAASSGVQLYNGSISDSMWVYNDNSGNTFIVYPPTLGQFNQLAVNSGVNLANNTNALFLKVTATRWLVILSA